MPRVRTNLRRLTNDQRRVLYRIPKEDWQELYRDLFFQAYGEDLPEQRWVEDAQQRLRKLERNGVIYSAPRRTAAAR